MKTKKDLVYLLFSALIMLASPALSTAALAQTDTIRVHDQRLSAATLKEGTRRYLVYAQSPNEKKTLRMSLWLRNTRLEKRNNELVWITTQNWYGSDSTGYRTGYSVNRMRDFSPLFHREASIANVRAFNWADKQVSGTDTVLQNSMKDFHIDLSMPCFNWNLDIELFEMLPLAKDKVFAIPFYDAGLGQPAYALYQVGGSEIIAVYGAQRVDCWKLIHEGEAGGQHYVQTFWISKKDHELLKEEDSYAGGFRYKIKLPAYTGDLP